jgi:DNA-directed RNA polymerase subunit alpha
MSYPFKMPDGVILDESTVTPTYGKFTVQPLERGFGVTLGNSFRRVLLSSLSGAAITAIKIDGILHEFTTVPGVVEDVTDIILNLKKVRIKMDTEKPVEKAELSLTGPGNFTAKDIQEAAADLQILNPDLHIATLNEGAKLNIELRFGVGRGYVPSNEQKIEDQTIGVIPIDSIFSPIRNVKYFVENVRIGERNDYEKLTIEVTTDGSITPEEALSQAAQILSKHVQMFIHFETSPEEKEEEVKYDAETERIRKILMTSVDDLELSVRSHNCLKQANIETVGDLVSKTEQELLKFRNFGRKSLSELSEIVSNLGLEFGMDVDKYLKSDSGNNSE